MHGIGFEVSANVLSHEEDSVSTSKESVAIIEEVSKSTKDITQDSLKMSRDALRRIEKINKEAKEKAEISEKMAEEVNQSEEIDKLLKERVISLEIDGIDKRANNKFMEYFGYLLLAATSGALLWFFSCIWVKGSHYIHEPNIMVLGLETAVMAAILGFALHKLVRIIRGKAK